MERHVSSKTRFECGTGSRRRTTISLLLPTLLLVLASVLPGCTDLSGAEGLGLQATSTTEEAFQQAQGEIILEPAGVAGPESFTGETFVSASPPSTVSVPTTSKESTTTTAAAQTTAGATGTTAAATQTTQVAATTTTVAGVQVRTVSGGSPALYGGSKSRTLVDIEGQLTFFEQNPDKAAAFCAALNADPTFQWSGGSQVQPSQLRDYFAELTPLVLTQDTRVTNHGYRDGKPTPRQAVLQAGQMVLVDRYGIPRVRCECGNPLAPPKPVTKTPKYTGPKWPGFDPVNIIVIQQTTVVIESFVLVDVATGEIFGRTFGTQGPADVVDTFGAWNIAVDLTWDDDYNIRVTNVSWSGGMTLDPYPALDGAGDGTIHVDGTVFDETTADVTGDWLGDASFTVDISGGLYFSGGVPMLSIQPVMGDYSAGNISINSTNPGGVQGKIEALLPSLVAEAFVSMDALADPAQTMVIDIVAGNFSGTATLTPYEP